MSSSVQAGLVPKPELLLEIHRCQTANRVDRGMCLDLVAGRVPGLG